MDKTNIYLKMFRVNLKTSMDTMDSEPIQVQNQINSADVYGDYTFIR